MWNGGFAVLFYDYCFAVMDSIISFYCIHSFVYLCILIVFFGLIYSAFGGY